MNKTSGELRRSRESFARTLEKICSRIDSNPAAEFSYSAKFIGLDGKIDCRVRAKALWVVGSFARGATDCGDLDLVLDYEMLNKSTASGALVAKALFKTFPRVRVYGGTPASNESNVAFQEAVLVWNGAGCDWKKALEAISESQDASRFKRETDRIPFRTEQLHPRTDFDKLIELESKGIIRWHFTSLSELGQVAPNNDDAELAKEATSHFSSKTMRLLPFLLDYFRKSTFWPKPMLRYVFEQTYFCYGGMSVNLGRSDIQIDLLDEFSTSDIIIMPHITSRGPNGIMRIMRGDTHPLVTASAGLKGYCVVDEDGEPEIADRVDSGYRSSNRFYPKELDIFSTKRMASARARMYSEDGDGIYGVRVLNSSDIIRLLSYIDIAWIYDQEHALTTLGSRTAEDKVVSSSAEILKAFKKQ